VLGAGERLFAEASDEKPMRLGGTQAGDDVVFLTYEPVRDAKHASNGASAPKKLGRPTAGRASPESG
jgi:hypothetical protein